MKTGATGEFPEGKLTPDDLGSLVIAIGVHEGKVILDFGENPVDWVGFLPEHALDLASNIARVAQEVIDGRVPSK
jgi:hypothetical protein